GAKEEDGFIYLSDPFIRRLVGPKLKLTEMHRMICYNDLRMIGHAALMYRTQFGQTAKSLEDLVRTGCAPELFGQGNFACPDGGHYTLSADGMTAHCTVHGDVNSLTPDYDIPLDKVSSSEASAYNDFVKDYNQYWRSYFDPLAIRMQITPKRYRLETLILPLIDNSVYTGMAQVLGGKPESLDALPVPSRNIFSLALHYDKQQLIKTLEPYPGYSADGKQKDATNSMAQSLGVTRTQLTDFLNKGIGNQIALHVYDAPQMFDFNFPELMAEMMGTFGGRTLTNDPIFLYIGLLIEALNAPIYLSVPVQDKQIVDDFLGDLDKTLLAQPQTSRNFLDLSTDLYQLQMKDHGVHSFAAYLGPIKWRFFWSRVGDGLYIATKPDILDDLIVEDLRRSLADGPAPTGPQPIDDSIANGLIKVRAQNWQRVLPDFRLGWEENSRQACISNVGTLSGIARSMTAAGKVDTLEADAFSAELQKQAEELYGIHLFCPDGGKYQLSADKKSVACSIHGTAQSPKQPNAPVEDSDLGKLLNSFGGLTGALTFTGDGLRAVVTIDRK
ncbi:MAG TPA: hypothetical protein VFC63_05520, partial [Blastocatellia bacterium]|nr:hypothetical protein [Blastocatellia bacterium]